MFKNKVQQVKRRGLENERGTNYYLSDKKLCSKRQLIFQIQKNKISDVEEVRCSRLPLYIRLI